MSSSISAPPPDRNTEELTVMARMLRRSTGQFALAFARCNSPVQRASLVAILRDSLAALHIPIAEVTLSGPEADIHAELAAAAAPNAGAPLFVYSLESVMPSDPLSDKPSEAQYRALAQLNERRGRYQTLARPLVFWVPEYALRLVAEVAGDFWGWRSGVFEFATEPEVVRETFQREATLPYPEMTNLTRAEKEARIRVLNALLDDYEGDDAETRAARSNVLYRLGQMHRELGQFSQAERLYHESLKTYEGLGDKHGVAVTQYALGGLARLRGDYAQAESLFRASLRTDEELGDKRGVAVTQYALGELAQLRGDYAQAESLFRASLKTKEELGDRREVAVTQHALGDLAQLRGDYEQAESLLRTSLKTKEELGDRQGVAVTQTALGELARLRGDYAQAESLFRESLKTAEELGDKRGVAVTFHNLALLRIPQERLPEALELLARSRDLLREIGLEKDAASVEETLRELQRRPSEAQVP